MEIKVYQMKFQDSEDELKSITGSLVLKTQRLAEEELKCKWFGIRESVLREKTIELVNRENCFRNEKVSSLSNIKLPLVFSKRFTRV